MTTSPAGIEYELGEAADPNRNRQLMKGVEAKQQRSEFDTRSRMPQERASRDEADRARHEGPCFDGSHGAT